MSSYSPMREPQAVAQKESTAPPTLASCQSPLSSFHVHRVCHALLELAIALEEQEDEQQVSTQKDQPTAVVDTAYPAN